MSYGYPAWAAVGKVSESVLRDLKGHYAIYTHRKDAKKDCPTYGEVRRVYIRVSTIKAPR